MICSSTNSFKKQDVWVYLLAKWANDQKCQLRTASLPLKHTISFSTPNKLGTHVLQRPGCLSPVSFMNMVLTFENKHKWDHLASPEIPREAAQNQGKILEGYKLRIKVLERRERRQSSRCETRQGGRICIKAVKIYNRFNGQLFFAFVHWLEFAWACQMPWKRCAIRMEERLSLCPTCPVSRPHNVTSSYSS